MENLFRAWGHINEPENYRLIIDCLLNTSAFVLGNRGNRREKICREIAEKHIHTAIANVIREDYSTWHTFYFDMKTGAPDHGATCQGYRDGSAWARGQAWGIYGCALAYRYTGEKKYIENFKHVTGCPGTSSGRFDSILGFGIYRWRRPAKRFFQCIYSGMRNVGNGKIYGRGRRVVLYRYC